MTIHLRRKKFYAIPSENSEMRKPTKSNQENELLTRMVAVRWCGHFHRISCGKCMFEKPINIIESFCVCVMYTTRNVCCNFPFGNRLFDALITRLYTKNEFQVCFSKCQISAPENLSRTYFFHAKSDENCFMFV